MFSFSKDTTLTTCLIYGVQSILSKNCAGASVSWPTLSNASVGLHWVGADGAIL